MCPFITIWTIILYLFKVYLNRPKNQGFLVYFMVRADHVTTNDVYLNFFQEICLD